MQATPPGSPPSAAVGQVVLNGRTHDFHFPDSPNVRHSVQNIFKGREYPHVNLPEFPPKAIMDIGANLGAAAMMFATLFPDTPVYCFEPSSANLVFLRRNIAAMANVQVIPFGLLDRNETTKLYTGLDRSMQSSLAPSAETIDSFETIEVRRASEEFDRLGITQPSIIKIDTEGCELAILRDLGARLDATERLYVEYHSDDDRRAIDALLGERFVLASARTPLPHRGSMMYLSRRVMDACPRLGAAPLRVR